MSINSSVCTRANALRLFDDVRLSRIFALSREGNTRYFLPALQTTPRDARWLAIERWRARSRLRKLNAVIL
jgi:hypothetical protein